MTRIWITFRYSEHNDKVPIIVEPNIVITVTIRSILFQKENLMSTLGNKRGYMTYNVRTMVIFGA